MSAGRGDLSFNPCCNGKCSGRELRKPINITHLPVSILVVMESAQEVHRGGHALAELPNVSILVVMESAQEANPEHQQGCDKHVSILVVMESAQEECITPKALLQFGRFNPCCNGKCSGRGRRVNPQFQPRKFQSLL